MKRLSSKQARACAIPASVKSIVYRRDRGLCLNCGKPGDPVAHFISRKRGGLGVPQNILTLCEDCHKKFDTGTRQEREGMRESFAEYLRSQYPDWDESKLVYSKWRNEE